MHMLDLTKKAHQDVVHTFWRAERTAKQLEGVKGNHKTKVSTKIYEYNQSYKFLVNNVHNCLKPQNIWARKFIHKGNEGRP